VHPRKVLKKNIEKKEETPKKGKFVIFFILATIGTNKRKNGNNYQSDILKLEEELKKLKLMMAENNSNDIAAEKQGKSKTRNTRQR